jgi:predicted kinase
MSSSSFLLQMAGLPGSGKSTLARVIAKRTGAVALDKDVLKTAALDTGADEALAGRIAYEGFFGLAAHLLGQGLSVVLDSPSFYETIPAHGANIAADRLVPYYFIECFCSDREELARRLRGRPRLRSNPGEEALAIAAETIAPPGAYLRIDTTQPLERCLAIALEYLGWSDGE